jgi:hypothetical protein
MSEIDVSSPLRSNDSLVATFRGSNGGGIRARGETPGMGSVVASSVVFVCSDMFVW